MNVQVVADPKGRLLWASPALADAVHDVRAAREHGITDGLAEAGITGWADKGYQGAGDTVRLSCRDQWDRLPVGRQAAHRPHAKVRVLVEQAIATLKSVDACDWAWRGPEWLRPAVGGLALGLVLLALPEMYGVGYPVLQKAAEGGYAVGFLLLLLAGKMPAASLTIGIGGSGGVFAPSLFIGAMLGSAYGATAHQLLPQSAGPVGAYALIGMGAVVAGAARAPITAVVILFELTGEYSIILPLMTAIVLATATSRLLTGDTIYTLKLRRRGIDLEGPARGAQIGAQPVGAVMDPLPSPLPASTTLADAADLLSLSGHGALPVTDDSGEYVGVVTAQAVAEALAEQPDAAPTLVGQLAEQPPRRQTDELRSPHSTDRTCSMRCCSTPDGSRCRRRTPSHPSASRPSAVPHPAAPEKGTPYPAGHTTWGPQQARKAAAEPHVRHFTCIMQNESGSEKSGPGTEA